MGLGYLFTIKLCPMLGFSKKYAGPICLSIGTSSSSCSGLGMLGIDYMKHKISLVVFVAVFLNFAPLPLFVSDILLGGQGG